MRPTGNLIVGSLFVITLTLVLLGVVSVLSASQFVFSRNPDHNVYAYMGRQLMYFSLGLGGLAFFAFCDYNRWESRSLHLMLFSMALLALVLTPMGTEVNGARRWLRVLGFSVQPSDILKFSVIVYLAAVWAERRGGMESFFRGVLRPLLVTGAALALVVAEPDHSTTAYIGALALVVWFAAGGRLTHLAPVFVLLIIGIIFALYHKPHLYERLLAFWNPEAYPDKNYQVIQAIRGIGYGGMWGAGLGEGMQQLGFIPEIHTDFIFATIGEELGFVKSAAVLGLYAMLCVLGFWIAIRCGNPFGKLLAVGCTAAIGMQAGLNVAVVTGCVPTTGISLPFISYGGSSLTVFMSMVGLLMSVARDTFVTETYARREA